MFQETECIATPELNDLRRQCFKDIGVAVFNTKPRRLWLQKFLFLWAHKKMVSTFFSVGWNSDRPDHEYRLQLELGILLRNSLP